MNLKGLTIHFLGDSITEGVGTSSPEQTYHQRLREKYQWKNAYNYGLSGTRIAPQREPSNCLAWDLYFALRAESMGRKADAVVVFGGTNDYGHGDAPFGAIDDERSDTFCGALHGLIKKLKADFPNSEIIFMTPLHRVDETKITRPGGRELKAYAEAMRVICEQHDIPVIDLFKINPMDPYDASLMPDGVHPNDAGHKILAQVIGEALEKILLREAPNAVSIRREEDFSLNAFLKKAKQFDPMDTRPYEEPLRYWEKNAKSVTPKSFGLRLVVISDTHGDIAFDDGFENFIKQIKPFDFLIILGDVTVYELDKIVKLVPKNKMIALRGNHDRMEQYEKYGIQNLNGRSCLYKNVRFAGIEGSFRYKNEDFPSFAHEESLRLASQMPQDADVLLTHDRMFTGETHDLAHGGLAGIAYYIYHNRVVWHIHGHVHKSYQKILSNGTIEKSVYGYELVEI